MAKEVQSLEGNLHYQGRVKTRKFDRCNNKIWKQSYGIHEFLTVVGNIYTAFYEKVRIIKAIRTRTRRMKEAHVEGIFDDIDMVIHLS